jgi:hypothetical protein
MSNKICVRCYLLNLSTERFSCSTSQECTHVRYAVSAAKGSSVAANARLFHIVGNRERPCPECPIGKTAPAALCSTLVAAKWSPGGKAADSSNLWQSRAVSGSLWQSRAVSGSLAQSRAVSGSLWQSRAVSGSLAQSRAVSGSLWQSRAVSGSLWQSRAVSGSLAQSRAVSGSLWQSLVYFCEQPITAPKLGELWCF